MSKRSWALSLFGLCAATLSLAGAYPKLHQPTLTPQNSGTIQGLIGVSPVNSRVVWASGRGGTFVVTTDGGQTWTNGVVPGAEALQCGLDVIDGLEGVEPVAATAYLAGGLRTAQEEQCQHGFGGAVEMPGGVEIRQQWALAFPLLHAVFAEVADSRVEGVADGIGGESL